MLGVAMSTTVINTMSATGSTSNAWTGRSCPIPAKRRLEAMSSTVHPPRAVSERSQRTTVPDAEAQPAPDPLQRDLPANALDERWCGDITHIQVGSA
ncbi:hypothetical protein GCM10020367_05030 [Streptomyces sannanensis]|uniref:Transposase n=1 Tax=Streptomyces sannanensis TaxID=285536 RepID=A0ABP6S4W7_9ACTN